MCMVACTDILHTCQLSQIKVGILNFGCNIPDSEGTVNLWQLAEYVS